MPVSTKFYGNWRAKFPSSLPDEANHFVLVGRFVQKRCFSTSLNNIYLVDHGLLAGTGFELFRISDSGVSVAGLPLKITRFGFAASVPTSSFAYVVTTFRFKRVTCSCFKSSESCLSVVLMKESAEPNTLSAPLATPSRFVIMFCKLST